jgi:hypothetical protein
METITAGLSVNEEPDRYHTIGLKLSQQPNPKSGR